MAFFSVVMPTYGVEKYIEKAINSIINQSFTDWELVIVNDCTKDKSAEIAEAYAEKNPKIRVIHHEKNRGLSQSRNTGIENSRGQYIWFMDPDDYVEIDVLEKVKDSLAKNPADVVLIGLNEEYYNEDGSFAYAHSIIPDEKLYSSKEKLRERVIELERDTLYGYAWNKFYNLDYLRKIKLNYETVTLIEDIVFNVEFFMNITSLNVLAIPSYHYAKRIDGSLTNKFVPDYYELHRRRIEMIFQQHKYWGLTTEKVKKILGALYARYIVSAIQRNCDSRANMRMKERKAFLRQLYKDDLFLELIPFATSQDSRALRIAISLLKSKGYYSVLAFGRAVDVAKRVMPIVFTKLRSQR